jgi:hypothetical protein
VTQNYGSCTQDRRVAEENAAYFRGYSTFYARIFGNDDVRIFVSNYRKGLDKK